MSKLTSSEIKKINSALVEDHPGLTGNFYLSASINYIDSPASTSAQTYTLMQSSADGSNTGYFESGMGGVAKMQIALIEFETDNNKGNITKVNTVAIPIP